LDPKIARKKEGKKGREGEKERQRQRELIPSSFCHLPNYMFYFLFVVCLSQLEYKPQKHMMSVLFSRCNLRTPSIIPDV
jgi:hypothetical protein